MSAETIAKALGGQRTGSGWVARCPAHDDRKPSLSITQARTGKTLVRCHAGCEQKQVIEALREKGLWESSWGRRKRPPVRIRLKLKDQKQERLDEDRTAYALKIWDEAGPAQGTMVETYLKSRGLTLPLPPTLRFHQGLKHRSGSYWPCMVALVSNGETDRPLSIHRTFLSADGRAKAPVEQQKMMLGPCRGGAVRLGCPDGLLMVGEGIETCLAAMQVTGHPAWAALSTSGLKALDLPETVREVIVLADGDEAGEAAACQAALHWRQRGRAVRIARPPEGQDFNDLLNTDPLHETEAET